MKRIVAGWMALSVLALAGSSDALVQEEGWTSLFDGKTLDGWKTAAQGESVEAVDGEIRILSKKSNLWLLHEATFTDFELEVDVKMPAGGYNSGVGFRCTSTGKKPKGYQCEVAEKKTGQIYAIGKGWVWPKTGEEKARFKKMAGDCFKTTEWNHLKIRCEGRSLKIWVNGTLTADVEDDKFASGSIALQHHGKGDVHRFRKIRIRPLGESSK